MKGVYTGSFPKSYKYIMSNILIRFSHLLFRSPNAKNKDNLCCEETEYKILVNWVPFAL